MKGEGGGYKILASLIAGGGLQGELGGYISWYLPLEDPTLIPDVNKLRPIYILILTPTTNTLCSGVLGYTNIGNNTDLRGERALDMYIRSILRSPVAGPSRAVCLSL